MPVGLLALTQTATSLKQPRQPPQGPAPAPAVSQSATPLHVGVVGERAGATWGAPRASRVRTPTVDPRPVDVYAGIRLTDVVGALSYALDITEGQPMGHSVRTTMIGMRVGVELGLEEELHSALFYTLLLKDLGCSSNAARLSQLFNADDRMLKQAHKLIDWTDGTDVARYALKYSRPGSSRVMRAWHALDVGRRAKDISREMVATRCERGGDIAGMLALPKGTSEAIRSLDEHWDGNGMPMGLRGAAIPLLARIAGLAQTVEVFLEAFDLQTAYDVTQKRRGRWFDPELVDCLNAFRNDTTFWGKLREADSLAALRAYEPPERVVYADELRLDTVAEAFAKVIDAKSPFTARHSQNVAFLATRTAVEMGMPRKDVRALRRAALLHDVGKLGVSNSILDKPGALDRDEILVMQRHTGHTLDILSRVGRFQRFAGMAAAHHERLDGTGYHLGLKAEDLTMAARVLAVSDVCEALSADRPYRSAMPLGTVMNRLDELAAAGHLCPVATEALTGWFGGLPANTGDHQTSHDDSTSLLG